MREQTRLFSLSLSAAPLPEMEPHISIQRGSNVPTSYRGQKAGKNGRVRYMYMRHLSP